jgi:hypothetical protein
MRYEEILGSDRYVRGLVETAALLREAGNPTQEKIGDDYIVIPPGGEIRQSLFI